jgi:hypothetical protein
MPAKSLQRAIAIRDQPRAVQSPERTGGPRRAKHSYGVRWRLAVCAPYMASGASILTWPAITRAFTLVYTLSLLTLLTRIQLNLLGRRNYLASVVSLAAPQPTTEGSRINLENNDDDNFEQAYGNDFETNRRYLSLSWWLLHKGCIDLIEKVRVAVKDVFGLVNPREEMTLERLSELTLEVRKRVEGATEEERRYEFTPTRKDIS